MAGTTKPKTSNKTKSPQKPRTPVTSPNRTAMAMERDRRRRNIWSVILFALGVLLIAFAFIGSADAESPTAWDAVHSFFRGIFGVTVFFVGPIFIYVAVMIALDKGKSTVSVKIFQLVLFLFLLSAAIQILFIGQIGSPEADGFGGVISEVYDAGRHLSGGGVLSILLGFPLLLLGRVGASIIICLIIFVVIMLITNVSIMDLFKFICVPFKKLGAHLKAKREQYEEESALVREEKQRLALEDEENRRVIESISEEEKRAKKFITLEALTSRARGEEPAAEADKKTLDEQAVEIVEEQSKDTEDFRKKLAEINGGKAKAEQLTVDTVETPAEEPAPAPEAADIPLPENAPEIPENAEPVNAVTEAIDGYNREKEEAAAEKEKNSQIVVDTVINTDDNGQQVIEDVIVDVEQYKLPPISLLNDAPKASENEDVKQEIESNSHILVNALKSFGVETKFLEAVRGPSVTRYELQPAPGVKIAKITGLVDDIALNLATAGVRIEAPIPNKAAVGIEVPNKIKETVPIREMIDSEVFEKTKSKLGAALGKNISGEVVICDISEMPHILIAGTTGAGKSVCVNSIIMSILFRSTPDEVRLIMIDPKAVEFMIYNGIPHLLIPVVTDPKKAAGALGWAVKEMEKRYAVLGENNVRDIKSYNELCKKNPDLEPMPHVVIFIDELADLMMSAKNDVETSICRIAQKARAAGMHLVVATQRPSVDVITGLIKSNIPSRIALKVASQVDSRTIMDTAGAEKLLGKGDMLYKSVTMAKPMRVQGCWVSDREVENVTEFIKGAFDTVYDESVIEEVDREAERVGNDGKTAPSEGGDIDISDDKLEQAIDIVIGSGKASTSLLQRSLSIGYGRAAKMIDTMEKMGVVGPPDGMKPRQILMTKEQYYERFMNTAD